MHLLLASFVNIYCDIFSESFRKDSEIDMLVASLIVNVFVMFVYVI